MQHSFGLVLLRHVMWENKAAYSDGENEATGNAALRFQ